MTVSFVTSLGTTDTNSRYTLDDAHELALALNSVKHWQKQEAGQYNNVRDERQKRYDAVNEKIAAFERIGEALKDAAIDAKLCEQYDEWLEKMGAGEDQDGELSDIGSIGAFFSAASRLREYRVLVSFESAVVYVMANSADDACDKASDESLDFPSISDTEVLDD